MRAFLVICFAVSSLTLHAQIKGKVTDSQTGAPLPYATVSLFSITDSLLVDGTITDDAGIFEISAKPGSYFAKFEFLAYEPFIVEKIAIKNAPLDLGNIKLKAAETMLGEVVVQAEKSSMQMSLDKRVFNVGKDLGNAGGNAAELLSNIPSVQVDVEGNVSLRGSGNVRILIDGKPSGLVSFNGAAGLQQLQGSMGEYSNPEEKLKPQMDKFMGLLQMHKTVKREDAEKVLSFKNNIWKAIFFALVKRNARVQIKREFVFFGQEIYWRR